MNILQTLPYCKLLITSILRPRYPKQGEGGGQQKMTQTQTAAAILATAIAAAGTLTYAALSAQSQIFGPVLIASRNPNEIALTYDDGPNDIATERLLEVLARHQTRATFFLIGRFVRERPQIARTI